MSEGPQVKLRTEWLHRHLAGRVITDAASDRAALQTALASLRGRRVTRCTCKGKHIFIELETGEALHNHLLMRGTWRREPSRSLFLPADVWLELCVGDDVLRNRNGQVLEFLSPEGTAACLEALGPDVMSLPFPRAAVLSALASTPLAIAETLLDQALIAGIGNIAKSEILHRAGIHPSTRSDQLAGNDCSRLGDVIEQVMWECYHNGGRWHCDVYRRRGRRCLRCGETIQLLRLSPSRRSCYFCPGCQPVPDLFHLK